MHSRKLQLGSLLLLFLAVSAWAQSTHYSAPVASIEDQFSAYHQALSGTADEVLATTAVGAPLTTASNLAVNASPHDDRRLHQFAQQYWNGEEQNVRQAVERVARLRPTVDPILREEGVPVDLAALVLVESGGRPTALSPKGALGLWQFMPETARRYGLVVGSGRDERLDVVKSTRAAARYLRDLYVQFKDWRLAFAAYNAGEEAIQRTIAQSGTRDFDNLGRLPLETRRYVPAVLTAVHLLGGAVQGERLPVRGSSPARVIYANAAITE